MKSFFWTVVVLLLMPPFLLAEPQTISAPVFGSKTFQETVTGKDLKGHRFYNRSIRLDRPDNSLPAGALILGLFWFPDKDDPEPNGNHGENFDNLNHITVIPGQDPLSGTKTIRLGVVSNGALPDSQVYRITIEVRYVVWHDVCVQTSAAACK
jgi:hypothetical protein